MRVKGADRPGALGEDLAIMPQKRWLPLLSVLFPGLAGMPWEAELEGELHTPLS